MSVALVLPPTTAVLEGASAGPAGHHLGLLLGFLAFFIHFIIIIAYPASERLRVFLIIKRQLLLFLPHK